MKIDFDLLVDLTINILINAFCIEEKETLKIEDNGHWVTISFYEPETEMEFKVNFHYEKEENNVYAVSAVTLRLYSEESLSCGEFIPSAYNKALTALRETFNNTWCFSDEVSRLIEERENN